MAVVMLAIYQSVFAFPIGSIDPQVKKFTVSNMTMITGEFDTNVVGKIKNISNETQYAMSAVVESYSANNQLIGVDEGDSSYGMLSVGQESPFEVSIDQAIVKDIDHYVVGVKSTNQEPKTLFDLADLAKNNTDN